MQGAISGTDLKLARISRGVRQSAVAKHFGARQERISQIEAAARPTKRAIDRYWDALNKASAEA